MSTFTKKVVTLTITFALAYTASALAFTYSTKKLEGIAAKYTYSMDHITVNEDYVGYATRKSLAETMLHELAHWTGHEVRADRAHLDNAISTFHEEIVAELTLLILCEVLNFKHAAYTIEEVSSYLETHDLVQDLKDVDMDRAVQEAQEASLLMIALFKGYGMLDSGEPFDVVGVIFPELAKINRGGE